MVLLSGSLQALATDHPPTWWGISAGQINVFRDNQLKNNLYGIELRFSPMFSLELIPSVGFQWGDAGFNYLYSDLKYPVKLNEQWYLTIGSGIGLYEESRFLDLGHTIEFRSGLELLYEFNKQQQLGLGVHHYSNSRLSSQNPGTESVTLIFLQHF
ncbi:acyloxyacyl hydrolase [Marinicella sediminis]|uniref:Acyloxyacyl hydrolase n=1 Tax=Marinicella sediminis TaxID=1792834 RepID=A0ABV7JCK6_9GAMM